MNERVWHQTLTGPLDEADIASFCWTIAAIRQKMIPLFLAHQHCPPALCGLSHPSFVTTAENIIAHLQVLVNAFNDDLVAHGKPPVKSFADGLLNEKGDFHA